MPLRFTEYLFHIQFKNTKVYHAIELIIIFLPLLYFKNIYKNAFYWMKFFLLDPTGFK